MSTRLVLRALHVESFKPEHAFLSTPDVYQSEWHLLTADNHLVKEANIHPGVLRCLIGLGNAHWDSNAARVDLLRYYTCSLAERQAGLLLTVSAALLGSMLGTFFPTTFTLVLLVALSFLDVVFIETNILGRTVGLQRISSLLSVTTLPISEFGVGLGDLLVYSILVTSSFIRGGAYVALPKVPLILLGVIAPIRVR